MDKNIFFTFGYLEFKLVCFILAIIRWFANVMVGCNPPEWWDLRMMDFLLIYINRRKHHLHKRTYQFEMTTLCEFT